MGKRYKIKKGDVFFSALGFEQARGDFIIFAKDYSLSTKKLDEMHAYLFSQDRLTNINQSYNDIVADLFCAAYPSFSDIENVYFNGKEFKPIKAQSDFNEFINVLKWWFCMAQNYESKVSTAYSRICNNDRIPFKATENVDKKL